MPSKNANPVSETVLRAKIWFDRIALKWDTSRYQERDACSSMHDSKGSADIMNNSTERYEDRHHRQQSFASPP